MILIKLKGIFGILLLIICITANSQTANTDSLRFAPVSPIQKPEKNQNWSDLIKIRGYLQVRYNSLYQTNPDLQCQQCDRSWGGNGGFFIRRMRVIIYGQIHERVFLYIQPDFASSAASDNLHFTQLRDAYFDLGLDVKNEFRFRIGQSKVPFGFENMQSSQNRLPLDRNDALNSAVLNERDLGVFFYWAPEKIRKRFSYLVNSGLKGTGDYGVFGFGLYNGQTANKPDLNNTPHKVIRLTYPFQIGEKQIIEPSIQAYTGQWTIAKNLVSDGVDAHNNFTYLDRRAATTLCLYPQPFGFLAEYNIGTGPEYSRTTNDIRNRDLRGGFITLNYMKRLKHGLLYPFIRMHHYQGGKKFETDARSYTVNEYEFGMEWEPFRNFELVVMYTHSRRRFEDAKRPRNVQEGGLIRIQAQVNF